MPGLVRITEIGRPTRPDALIHAWNLESPQPGALVEASGFEVRGWVIAEDVPAVALEIKNYGHVVRRTPIKGRRPDVTAAYPGVRGTSDSGFRTVIPVIGPDPGIDLELSVLFADRRAVSVARVCGERTWRGETQPVDEALVSVVIPAYDQAHFLRDAIESVVAQTHPHIELVVVDDGSHDNTAEIAASYPGVRCVRQENRGLAEARNTGIRHTIGDYLVFLDADDRLRPEALEAGLKAFAARPECGYVFGEFVPIAYDGSALKPHPSPGPEGGYLDLLTYNFIPIHAVMFRRGMFEGGRGFNPDVWANGAGADWDCLLTGMHEFPVYGHGSVVCEYRRHASSMNRDAEMIMRSELAVLRRHRAAARKVVGGRQAHRAGVRRCKSHHGPLLADQVRAAIAKHDWTRALSGVSALARYYPRGLFLLLSKSGERAPMGTDPTGQAMRKGAAKGAVGGVHHHEPLPDSLIGRHIDRPSANDNINNGGIDIAGWVLGKVGVDSVQADVDGTVVRVVPVDVPRPDLAEAFPDVPAAETSGFQMWLDLSDLPVEGNAEVVLSALLADGETAPLGVIAVSPIP